MKRLQLGITAALVALVLPMAAQAQMKAEQWEWRATLYGWFPGISGTTKFPSGAGGPTLNVDADKLIDGLKFAFMGTLEAQKGEWGIWTDIFYSDVGESVNNTRAFTIGQIGLPAGVNANLSLDAKTTIWTLAGTYSLAKSREHSAEALFGARMANMDQTLTWSINGSILGLGLPGPSGSKDVSLTNWDAVVGIKGRASFGDDYRWFVPYYLDVGTGQSKLTWQALIGLGYEFSWGAILGGWRILDYEMDAGDPVQSLRFQGALVGVTFRF